MTVPITELSVGDMLELEGFKSTFKNDSADGQVEPNTGSKKTATAKGEELYPVPKELWFLCDLITKLGLHKEQLFLQPGLSSEIRAIRDWLDTGLPVDGPTNVSIHSAGEALLLLLESLRIPIVPYTMYPQCLERYVLRIDVKNCLAFTYPEQQWIFMFHKRSHTIFRLPTLNRMLTLNFCITAHRIICCANSLFLNSRLTIGMYLITSPHFCVK